MIDLASVATAINARLIGANAVFDRVTTDSRDLRPGDLFVGIRGERFDGQAFADQALAAGASAVMLEVDAKVLTPGARILLSQTSSARSPWIRRAPSCGRSWAKRTPTSSR